MTGRPADVRDDLDWTPTTFENCHQVSGPFYHGTAVKLSPNDLLEAGRPSNYQPSRIMNHIYFSTIVTSLAAQLAVALTGGEGRGYVYIVEPTGPFEDDPNVTNKRFRGNPTKSYRSKHPLRIVAELQDWEAQDPTVISGMLRNLATLREQGRDLIED